MYVANNIDDFTTNSDIHSINTCHKSNQTANEQQQPVSTIQINDTAVTTIKRMSKQKRF
jgi:hypothetical protein